MAKAFKYSQMDVNICYNLEEKPYKQERWNTSKMGIAELQSELEGFPLTCKGKPGQWGCKQQSTHDLYSVYCFVILFFLNLAICLCITEMIWSLITTAITAVICPFNLALLDLQTKEFFHFHAGFCHRSGVPCWIKIFVCKHCPISSVFFQKVVSDTSFLIRSIDSKEDTDQDL